MTLITVNFLRKPQFKPTMNAILVTSLMILTVFLVSCTITVAPENPDLVVAESTPPAAETPAAEPVAEPTPEAPVETAPAAPPPAPSAVTGATVVDTSTTHTTNMIDGGFEEASITIKAGDTVIWQNIRENSQLNKAMVIGTRECQKVKSKFFLPGSYYSYKFEKPMACMIVDGIFTTQSMTVIVK